MRSFATYTPYQTASWYSQCNHVVTVTWLLLALTDTYVGLREPPAAYRSLG